MSTPYPDTSVELNPSPTFLEAAKRICIEWEKLRILYNGALISLVVYAIDKTRPAIFQTFEFWAVCAGGAIIANICFLGGPIAEAYFHWIGVRHWAIRWSLLLVGTLIAAFLAGGVLFGMI
jgi:hypothetical protein